MVERVPVTIAGFADLQKELKTLKTVERPAVIRAIEEARAHGDLSENAEYHAAKEQQGHIESRISELEDWTSRAEVIDTSKLSGDRVTFGATVTVVDEGDKTIQYQIVGQSESNVKAGRISFNSPLGRALIGRTVGDEVEVSTPGGDKYFEITKIQFI